ncbi:MAG: type 4a pilus biogenesis protein PilO [Bryobacteraceae bacterium]
MVLAIGVVALLAADRLVLTPLGHLWTARSNRITDLRREIAQGSSLLQREQSIRRRWEEMKTNTLPNNPSLAEQQMLKAFDTWSAQSRVSITSITPQWKHDEDDYMTLECRVDAAGDLETLTQFLYAIEKGPMALKVESAELSAHDNTGQQMTLGMEVSGLVLTPQAK